MIFCFLSFWMMAITQLNLARTSFCLKRLRKAQNVSFGQCSIIRKPDKRHIKKNFYSICVILLLSNPLCTSRMVGNSGATACLVPVFSYFYLINLSYNSAKRYMKLSADRLPYLRILSGTAVEKTVYESKKVKS